MAKCSVEGSLDDPSGGTMWVRFTCARRAAGDCPLDNAGGFPDDIPQDVRHLSPSDAQAIGRGAMRRMLPAVRDACNTVPKVIKPIR